MTHHEHPNNDTPQKDWKDIQDMFDTPTQPDTQPLKSLLENFRNDLQHHPYVRAKAHNQALAASLWWLRVKR